MENAKLLLLSFAEKIEKILAEFSVNEKNALSLLNELRTELGKQYRTGEDGELFDACVCNALATINTAPNQKKRNEQLEGALAEAKEEIKTIAEFL